MLMNYIAGDSFFGMRGNRKIVSARWLFVYNYDSAGSGFSVN